MFTEEKIPSVYKDKNLRIRIHADNSSTFYGSPHSSQAAHDLMNENRYSEYTETYYYINSMYRDVCIMKRNGLVTKIKYVSSNKENIFIIRKIITIRGSAYESALTALKSSTDIDDEELADIKAIMMGVNIPSCSQLSIMVDYRITGDDLKSKNNTLYHYQTDTVISFEDELNIIPHPYSTKFINIGTFGITNRYDCQTEFNFKLRYVNHDVNASALYINIANTVYTLHPQRDSPVKSMQTRGSNGKLVNIISTDYIEIFSTSYCNTDSTVQNKSGVSVVKIPISEAREKLGVYTSYSEALSSGDVEGARKERLLSLSHSLEIAKTENNLLKLSQEKDEAYRKSSLLDKEHNLELMKKENAEVKQRLETETIENKRKQMILETKAQELENAKKALEIALREQDAKLQRENAEFNERLRVMRETQDTRLKQESLYWKDFYEHRSMVRKDTSDIVKFIPGLIIGLSGAFLAWNKFKTQPAPS